MKKNPVSEFWERIADCLEEEELFLYTKVKLIHELRSMINDSTETAKSIDMNDTFLKIAEYAEKDGYEEFAEAIRFQEPEEAHHREQ